MRRFITALNQANQDGLEGYTPDGYRVKYIPLPMPCMFSYSTFQDYSDPNHLIDEYIAKLKADLRKADPSDVQAAWDVLLAWLVMDS
jgi:hypothetical protein